MRFLEEVEKDIRFVEEDLRECRRIGSYSGVTFCLRDLQELHKERASILESLKTPIDRYIDKLNAEIDKKYL